MRKVKVGDLGDTIHTTFRHPTDIYASVMRQNHNAKIAPSMESSVFLHRPIVILHDLGRRILLRLPAQPIAP
jgi:hypothetical protein